MCKTGDELTENRRVDDEVFKREMVFEKGGLYCPVASLEPYIKHLNPKNEFLFQGSKKGSKIGVDDVCFDNMAVGERTLAEKMKHISKEAELLRVYTNHSIRPLQSQLWKRVGVKPVTLLLIMIVATKVSRAYRVTTKQTLTPKSLISYM